MQEKELAVLWWVQMTNGGVYLRETGELMDLIVAL